MNTARSLAVLFLSGTLFWASNASARDGDAWIACGDDQFILYEIENESVSETERLIFSKLDIPSRFSHYRNLDGFVECKPVNSGREILVTSWKGGVAKFDLTTRSVNFIATVPSAHSADVLPNNRIAVVGDYLRVYDGDNGNSPLIEKRLNDGHGLVWDPHRRILYVLSQNTLEEYKLSNWDTSTPELELFRTNELPGKRDGHDLMFSSNGALLVSTEDGAWYFNPTTAQFHAHPDLNPVYRIQSVVEDGDHLVWVRAQESWWGRGFFVKTGENSPKRIETPNLRLYKVRKL